MTEALSLSRGAGLVYGLLWENAWQDVRTDKYGRVECGGTTAISHQAIARICHLSKSTVIQAVDELMDAGLISCEWLERPSDGVGSWRRRYRVTHSSNVEALRHAIAVMPERPSERAKAMRESKEKRETVWSGWGSEEVGW